MALFSRIKPYLVEDWQRAHKFMSVRIATAGVAIEAFVQWFPDTATTVWNGLPNGVTDLLPSFVTRGFPIILLLGIIVARIMKKKTPDAG